MFVRHLATVAITLHLDCMTWHNMCCHVDSVSPHGNTRYRRADRRSIPCDTVTLIWHQPVSNMTANIDFRHHSQASAVQAMSNGGGFHGLATVQTRDLRSFVIRFDFESYVRFEIRFVLIDRMSDSKFSNRPRCQSSFVKKRLVVVKFAFKVDFGSKISVQQHCLTRFMTELK